MSIDDDTFSNRLKDRLADLPRTMRQVAQYFDANRLDVIAHSASELGVMIGTSDATVVRTAQALGYDGLSSLKRDLVGEISRVAPAKNFRATIAKANADTQQAVKLSTAEQLARVKALGQPQALSRLLDVAQLLDPARRIVLFGIGPTAYIVGYGAHLLRRYGRNAGVLNATGSGLADQLLTLEEGDAVLAFAYNLPYPEIETTLARARDLSLPIALVSDVDDFAGRGVDIIAKVPRGEADGMALHGATMVWLEALVIALAVRGSDKATESLATLAQLRQQLG